MCSTCSFTKRIWSTVLFSQMRKVEVPVRAYRAFGALQDSGTLELELLDGGTPRYPNSLLRDGAAAVDLGSVLSPGIRSRQSPRLFQPRASQGGPAGVRGSSQFRAHRNSAQLSSLLSGCCGSTGLYGITPSIIFLVAVVGLVGLLPILLLLLLAVWQCCFQLCMLLEMCATAYRT